MPEVSEIKYSKSPPVPNSKHQGLGAMNLGFMPQTPNQGSSLINLKIENSNKEESKANQERISFNDVRRRLELEKAPVS